jgi:hypothetical protein
VQALVAVRQQACTEAEALVVGAHAEGEQVVVRAGEAVAVPQVFQDAPAVEGGPNTASRRGSGWSADAAVVVGWSNQMAAATSSPLTAVRTSTRPPLVRASVARRVKKPVMTGRRPAGSGTSQRVTGSSNAAASNPPTAGAPTSARGPAAVAELVGVRVVRVEAECGGSGHDTSPGCGGGAARSVDAREKRPCLGSAGVNAKPRSPPGIRRRRLRWRGGVWWAPHGP